MIVPFASPNRLPAAPANGLDCWQEERLSSTDELLGVVQQVASAMADGGYEETDIFGVRLALEEALANAIKHGHHYDPAKRVAIRYRVGDDAVVARITDEGRGFDPARVPDPTDPENLERSSGRGLFLIRHFTSWAHYNETGNSLILCKLRSPRGRRRGA